MSGGWVQRFLLVLWDATLRMGPWFILSVLVAAGIKTFKLDKRIRKALERAGRWGVPLATVTGMVSPLCSCGILPVVASLLAVGVPVAPVMALLITSPVMSPDAFVLTWGVLGPTLAWVKLAGAAVMGLALGWLVQWMVARGLVPPDPWKPGSRPAEHHCVDPLDPDDPRRGLTVTIGRWRYFGLMLGDMTWTIGRFFVLALVLDALLVALVRPNAVKVLVGQPSLPSVLLAAATGLLLPLQQVAVVPILRGLLDLGASRGAAVALLLAGPVTSLPAIVFLAGTLHRRLLWAFLAVGVGVSVLLGMVLV